MRAPPLHLPGGEAVVPRRCLLLRGRFSCEHAPSSRQRNLRTPFPAPVRISAGRRPVVLHGQPWGALQPRRGLLTHLPRRELRSAQDPARAPPRGRYPRHLAHGRAELRSLPWGTAELSGTAACCTRAVSWSRSGTGRFDLGVPGAARLVPCPVLDVAGAPPGLTVGRPYRPPFFPFPRTSRPFPCPRHSL